jgi:hypothetical protein
MSKIVLENVAVKRFANVIKRSASMDNLIFITVKGSEFESTAYNANKSALKAVSVDCEKLCDRFVNEVSDDDVKIQFSNANKLLSVLSLVGTEGVKVTFDIASNNYARKVTVENSEINLTVPCADSNALSFLEIPDKVRYNIFEDTTNLLYKFDVNDVEFKYINQLFGLNKESVRIFFNKIGNDVYLSEIESTDENVRATVNEIINDEDFDAFKNFEKLYCKTLNTSNFDDVAGVEKHTARFNKRDLFRADNDKRCSIEFHKNRSMIVSYDDESGMKTFLVLTSIKFA